MRLYRTSHISELPVGDMPSIGLNQMREVQLMSRVDEKYVMNLGQLQQLLSAVSEQHYVVDIGGKVWTTYRSLYLDTPDLQMYTAHHNGRQRRQKLRMRTYLDTGLTFCEVKNRTNKGKTHKHRLEVSQADFYAPLDNQSIRNYLSTESEYPLDNLLPTVESTFERMTLVDRDKTTRITIDAQIHFHNHTTEIEQSLAPWVVMEVKHEVGAAPSAMHRALLDLRIHPTRISKYCIGTALTNPQAKQNRFKPKLLTLNL